MYYQPTDGGFLARLERGEELIAGLAQLMRREQIGHGAVTGLGAIDRVRLGIYSVERKAYAEKELEGELEVVGLTGTLSWHEGEPFPHVHLLVTADDFRAFGGHCFEARVSATVELWVPVGAQRVDRHADAAIGLHLMALEGRCDVPG